MNDRGPPRGWDDVDPFPLAVGFAVLSGALALALPFLVALSGTLAALAVAAWIWRLGRDRVGRARYPSRSECAGWAVVGLGAVAFLATPPPWDVARGLALGLSLVPLWWIGRRPRRGPPVRESPP